MLVLFNKKILVSQYAALALNFQIFYGKAIVGRTSVNSPNVAVVPRIETILV
ncbi:MAG: hypothetical protein ACFFDT_06425 [Candidatus Hodarchaeota archaeon]